MSALCVPPTVGPPLQSDSSLIEPVKGEEVITKLVKRLLLTKRSQRSPLEAQLREIDVALTIETNYLPFARSAMVSIYEPATGHVRFFTVWV